MEEKKRGFFSQLWHDFNHMEDLIPERIDYYNDGKVEKFRIVHKPNAHVPVIQQSYEDFDKGIELFHSSNNPERIKKKIKWEDQ